MEAVRLINGAPAPASIVLPKLLNRDELMEFMHQHYPESAESDPTIMPVAWMFVDDTGAAHFEKLITITNDSGLDSLASAIATKAKFTPAQLAGTTVSLWLPVAFTLEREAPRGASFQAYTVKPQLLNRDAVSRRLVAEYPRHLKDAGTSGDVLVWVLVDVEGRATKTQVKRGSGWRELDQAALNVARGMQFTPAKHRGKPVTAWIQIPISFKTR